MAIVGILGILALLALSKPRVSLSHTAFARLGVVTDTEYLTLTPTGLLPAVEITEVQVLVDPVVVGTYAKLLVYLKANAASPLLGDFCRIVDDDTGAVVGKKKDWYLVANGDTWIAYYDKGLVDWNAVMPNRIWNLRIEVGTN